jgi:hypothetical protein
MNVTQNLMSSFVPIVFSSYEVILNVIFSEEIIQPKVGQASKCVPGLGTILFQTVKSSGSTDADDFCFIALWICIFVVTLTC